MLTLPSLRRSTAKRPVTDSSPQPRWLCRRCRKRPRRRSAVVPGRPAMTVPLGRHDGLPVGIHFAARPGADQRLLELAYELEAAKPWADDTPDLSWLTRPA